LSARLILFERHWIARGVAAPPPARTMIPTRVTHNPIIGPGVVPMGVDPAYDAQYANHKGPTAHVGANGHGRPFSVAPGPITHTQ
jgi:20S proteasome subunit beta 7